MIQKLLYCTGGRRDTQHNDKKFNVKNNYRQHFDCECCVLCYFMLSVIYAECHLYWVSFMLSINYAECHLCWVSFMLSAIYAECHLCWVSFMLSVIYAESHLCTVKHFYCYAEGRGTMLVLGIRLHMAIYSTDNTW